MRKFHLGDLDTNQDYSAGLREALKAGAFFKLEELVLFRGSIHQSLWEALEAGSCPELMHLTLIGVLLSGASSGALASATASGAVRKLQNFDHGGTGADSDDEDSSIAEVLAATVSSCPDLRRLNISAGFRNPATR